MCPRYILVIPNASTNAHGSVGEMNNCMAKANVDNCPNDAATVLFWHQGIIHQIYLNLYIYPLRLSTTDLELLQIHGNSRPI